MFSRRRPLCQTVKIIIKINGKIHNISIDIGCLPDTPIKELKAKAKAILYAAFQVANYNVAQIH